METRQKQLLDLKCYLQTVDTEVTMILQSLQWDRKRLLEGTSKATCQYDAHHKVPSGILKIHEDNCRLKKLGYCGKDEMLPGPIDEDALSLVKFSMADIHEIINNAAQKDPLFKRVCEDSKPLTLERQQATYTADERRAIYDAVVQAAPTRHDLNDLALPSTSEESQKGAGTKTRLEILAELRDMKRRRTKYRVAAKTKNYSDVLRDVIKTQMEVYSEVNAEPSSTTTHQVSKGPSNIKDNSRFTSGSNHKYRNETKLDDSYSKEEHKKHREHRLDSSRERHGETRNSLESKRRHDYEDKHRENRQEERRHTSEKDKYYKTDSDRRKSCREKEYRSKYSTVHGRETQQRSSKDRSKDDRSHRDRGNKKYDKEDRGHKHKLDKDEKYTRYYDIQHEDKRKRYK